MNRDNQNKEGRARYPGSEWGENSEFGKNDERWSRPYDMDNFKTGKQFSKRPMEGIESYGHTGKGPKGYRRSEERIYDEACEALFHSPAVDASDIEVSVKEGHLTLSGTVKTRVEKREAEYSVEHLAGVIDIHNQLKIKSNVANEGQH